MPQNIQTVKPSFHNRRFVCEQGQKLFAEQEQEAAADHACKKCIKKGCAVSLVKPSAVAGPQILAHETLGSSPEGKHDGESNGVRIQGSGMARDGIRIERIDSGLQIQIGNGEG